MKFKILFIFTVLISLVGLDCASNEESELKVISAELEKEVIKQGESTKAVVTVKNVGDSPVHDIYFFLRLDNLYINEIEIAGHDQKQDIGAFMDYYIDAGETILAPGEIKTAVYVISATSPRNERYTLIFGAEGSKQTNEVSSLWPRCVDALKVYLNVELIELPPDFYLNKAEEYLNSGGYENADIYAEKAKEGYIKSGNTEGALKCDKIISESEKMLEAYVAYKRVRNRIEVGDLQGAMSNAELSLKIYNEIDSDLISVRFSGLISERVSELELMIEELNKEITAWEYFLNATRYLDSGDYENAEKYAEKAKEIYTELDDIDLVLKCDLIINRSELNISRNSMISNIVYVVGSIILLLVIFLVYRKYNEGYQF